MSKKEEFLKELTELSLKYSMYIGGCGCCGSPFVDDENGKEIFEDLSWDYDNQKYSHGN